MKVFGGYALLHFFCQHPESGAVRRYKSLGYSFVDCSKDSRLNKRLERHPNHPKRNFHVDICFHCWLLNKGQRDKPYSFGEANFQITLQLDFVDCNFKRKWDVHPTVNLYCDRPRWRPFHFPNGRSKRVPPRQCYIWRLRIDRRERAMDVIYCSNLQSSGTSPSSPKRRKSVCVHVR